MTTSTMSSAWQRTTQHQRSLQALTMTIENDPAMLSAAVREARTQDFDSLDDLLLEAHSQWVRTFNARIDILLENGAYGDKTAFDQVWAETAQALPGTAMLLEHFADHPAVVRAHAQHTRFGRRVLAVELPSTWTAPARREPEHRGWRGVARVCMRSVRFA